MRLVLLTWQPLIHFFRRFCTAIHIGQYNNPFQTVSENLTGEIFLALIIESFQGHCHLQVLLFSLWLRRKTLDCIWDLELGVWTIVPSFMFFAWALYVACYQRMERRAQDTKNLQQSHFLNLVFRSWTTLTFDDRYLIKRWVPFFGEWIQTRL